MVAAQAPNLTSARVAVSAIFLLHGVASGMWVSRIPAVQEELSLGLAALGLALLGAGLGSLLSMLPMGALCAHVGGRRLGLGAGLAASVAFVLLALASDAWTLFGALVVWGAG